MARMVIKLSYVDGRTVELPVTARVEVAVERKFDLALSECRRREQVYFAAWAALNIAAQQTGTPSPAFDEEWLGTIETAEFAAGEEAEEPGPTQAAESASLSS
jgi:hypothetical protein